MPARPRAQPRDTGHLANKRPVSLDGQCVHTPHDAVVPDALRAGDLPELGAAIIRSGRKLIVSGLRDGANRRVTTGRVCALWGAESFQPEERSVLRDLVRELTEAIL